MTTRQRKKIEEWKEMYGGKECKRQMLRKERRIKKRVQINGIQECTRERGRERKTGVRARTKR